MGFEWTRLKIDELPRVSEIATSVHPGFPEGDEIFAERLRLCPEGCWLLSVDGEAAGYVVSHPVRLGQLPRLNSLFGSIPPEADSFYIHDLALLTHARGTGAARQIVSRLATQARDRGFETMSLVAVNTSQRFWESQWFVVADRSDVVERLKSYEDAACFMVRQLV